MSIRSYALLTILAGLPASAELWFVPNAGQVQPAVRFMVKTPRITAYFLPTEICFSVKDAQVGFQLLGANRAARISGGKQMPGKVNFLLGNQPEQWRHDIPVYAEVRYTAIYPG